MALDGGGADGGQVAAGLTILIGVAVALAPGEHLKLSRPVLTAGITFGVLAAVGNGFGAVLSRRPMRLRRRRKKT